MCQLLLLHAACDAVQLQQPALFSCPGFQHSRHTGYDVMHLVSGVMHHTVVGLVTGKRWTEAVMEYERTQNGNRFRDVRSRHPFLATPAELQRMQAALRNIVQAADSRVVGSRFLRLLSPSKKNKSHAYAVLASDYGESQCPPPFHTHTCYDCAAHLPWWGSMLLPLLWLACRLICMHALYYTFQHTLGHTKQALSAHPTQCQMATAR